jgi:polyphosphate kinase 2 (PPK2 family)
VKPFCKSKKRYKKLLEEHVDELNSLQRLHYASNRYALLLIFQGMDAAGKDGAIRHVMSGVNPLVAHSVFRALGLGMASEKRSSGYATKYISRLYPF